MKEKNIDLKLEKEREKMCSKLREVCIMYKKMKEREKILEGENYLENCMREERAGGQESEREREGKRASEFL